MSQPGARLSLMRPWLSDRIRSWPTCGDSTTLPGWMSAGRTTPVSTTTCDRR